MITELFESRKVLGLIDLNSTWGHLSNVTFLCKWDVKMVLGTSVSCYQRMIRKCETQFAYHRKLKDQNADMSKVSYTWSSLGDTSLFAGNYIKVREIFWRGREEFEQLVSPRLESIAAGCRNNTDFCLPFLLPNTITVTSLTLKNNRGWLIEFSISTLFYI